MIWLPSCAGGAHLVEIKRMLGRRWVEEVTRLDDWESDACRGCCALRLFTGQYGIWREAGGWGGRERWYGMVIQVHYLYVHSGVTSRSIKEPEEVHAAIYM